MDNKGTVPRIHRQRSTNNWANEPLFPFHLVRGCACSRHRSDWHLHVSLHDILFAIIFLKLPFFFMVHAYISIALLYYKLQYPLHIYHTSYEMMNMGHCCIVVQYVLRVQWVSVADSNFMLSSDRLFLLFCQKIHGMRCSYHLAITIQLYIYILFCVVCRFLWKENLCANNWILNNKNIIVQMKF